MSRQFREGYLHKSDPSGKNWKRRYATSRLCSCLGNRVEPLCSVYLVRAGIVLLMRLASSWCTLAPTHKERLWNCISLRSPKEASVSRVPLLSWCQNHHAVHPPRSCSRLRLLSGPHCSPQSTPAKRFGYVLCGLVLHAPPAGWYCGHSRKERGVYVTRAPLLVPHSSQEKLASWTKFITRTAQSDARIRAKRRWALLARERSAWLCVHVSPTCVCDHNVLALLLCLFGLGWVCLPACLSVCQSCGGAAKVHASLTAKPRNFEGWILKTDPEGRNWTQRWLVLDAATFTMSYYEDDEKKNKPKGVISLYEASLHVGSENAALRNIPAFSIETLGRTYRLCADSNENCLSWCVRVRVPLVPCRLSFRLLLLSLRLWWWWLRNACAHAADVFVRFPLARVVFRFVSLPSFGKPARVNRISATIRAADEAAERSLNNSDMKRPYAGMLQKSNPKGKYWKKRWIVLDPVAGTVAYYTNESKKTKKGEFSIKNCTLSVGCSSVKTPTIYCILVHTKERTWYLCAKVRASAPLHVHTVQLLFGACVCRSGGGGGGDEIKTALSCSKWWPHELNARWCLRGHASHGCTWPVCRVALAGPRRHGRMAHPLQVRCAQGGTQGEAQHHQLDQTGRPDCLHGARLWPPREAARLAHRGGSFFWKQSVPRRWRRWCGARRRWCWCQ